jgi:hypothetical protein
MPKMDSNEKREKRGKLIEKKGAANKSES